MRIRPKRRAVTTDGERRDLASSQLRLFILKHIIKRESSACCCCYYYCADERATETNVVFHWKKMKERNVTILVRRGAKREMDAVYVVRPAYKTITSYLLHILISIIFDDEEEELKKKDSRRLYLSPDDDDARPQRVFNGNHGGKKKEQQQGKRSG